MTAEIAILNREAVAIAADSAATLSTESGQKILSSANKIFSLSKTQPVGIMIFGSALLMHIPWETIIKMYRRWLGDKSFSTLKEYGNSFIQFLKQNKKLFPQEQQRRYINFTINSYYYHFKTNILKEIENNNNNGHQISSQEIEKLIDVLTDKDFQIWNEAETNIKNISKKISDFLTKYKKIIENAYSDTFEDLPISNKSKKILLKIAALLFFTFPNNIKKNSTSGVVITGFGNSQIFPSIVSYSIEGIADNILKYKESVNKSIDHKNIASIIPFAQSEMVHTFINGIHPRSKIIYSDILEKTLSKLPEIIIDGLSCNTNEKKDLLDKIHKITLANLKKGKDFIEEIQAEMFVNPIMDIVTYLPKNDLANMAESLVNLTCLRKKISTDDDTVGGPIDVAVISKGDGFIWIKRKHYFSPDLNKQYFENYSER
jgi:hypothetical protein